MIFKVLGCIMLLSCILGIIAAYRSANKNYQNYHTKAIMSSDRESSKTERYFRLFVSLSGIGVMSIILLSLVFDYYNNYLFLLLTLVYLSVYYINEYLPHTNWVIHKEGIISSRSKSSVEWQNIRSYRFMSKKDQEILIVEFKGKGLITQRGDFIINTDQRKKVEKILKERVIIC
ncbi:MAG: hypothetical protein K0S71_679 [Clostridia bacterium]|jgi:hypothetical protein|nr:hypothetical protein [Clostridia bacterium]